MSTNKLNPNEASGCSCEGPDGFCDAYEPGFNYGCFHSEDANSPLGAAINKSIVQQIDSQTGGADYESMNLVTNQDSEMESVMGESVEEEDDGGYDLDIGEYDPTGYYNKSSNYFQNSSWWMKILLCFLCICLVIAIAYGWNNRDSITDLDLGIASISETSASISDTLNKGVDQFKQIFAQAKNTIIG